MPAPNFSQQHAPCHTYEMPSLADRAKAKDRSLNQANLKQAPLLCNLAARRARQEMEPMQYREPEGSREGNPGGEQAGGAAGAGPRDFRGLRLAGGMRVLNGPQSPAVSVLGGGPFISRSGSAGPTSGSAPILSSGATLNHGGGMNGGASGSGFSSGRSDAPHASRFGGGAHAARVAYYLPMDVSSRFGARLRELRRERNMTQLRMATDFGIDRSFISDVERGRKSISLPMLEVIALGLGMTLSDLLSEI